MNYSLILPSTWFMLTHQKSFPLNQDKFQHQKLIHITIELQTEPLSHSTAYFMYKKDFFYQFNLLPEKIMQLYSECTSPIYNFRIFKGLLQPPQALIFPHFQDPKSDLLDNTPRKCQKPCYHCSVFRGTISHNTFQSLLFLKSKWTESSYSSSHFQLSWLKTKEVGNKDRVLPHHWTAPH